MKTNILLLLFIGVLLFTCQSCERYLYGNYQEATIQKQYAQSITDTKDVTRLPKVSDLLSVPADSSQLVWATFDGKPHVLAVMWKRESDLKYYKNDCKTGFYTSSRYDFVTIVPELKNLCRNKKFGLKEGLSLRLEQLLGLQPKSGKTHFIQVWVQPKNLIRPCLDIEISDRTCGFVVGDTVLQERKAYLKWLKENNASYPFTQLGYTYDWNKRKSSHRGMSEFLIDKNSAIVIKDMIETCEYCYLKTTNIQKK